MTRPDPQPTKARLCRTPADAFNAGWSDGAHDRALNQSERAKLAALIAPTLRDQRAAA